MKYNRLELLKLYHIFHALFLKVFERFVVEIAVKPRTSAVSACGSPGTSVTGEKCRDFVQMCGSRSAARPARTDGCACRQIGEEVGMTVKTINRILTRFVKDGLISTERGKISPDAAHAPRTAGIEGLYL